MTTRIPDAELFRIRDFFMSEWYFRDPICPAGSAHSLSHRECTLSLICTVSVSRLSRGPRKNRTGLPLSLLPGMPGGVRRPIPPDQAGQRQKKGPDHRETGSGPFNME